MGDVERNIPCVFASHACGFKGNTTCKAELDQVHEREHEHATHNCFDQTRLGSIVVTRVDRALHPCYESLA